MKFGTDGIRGPAATVVTPTVAWALGRAMAELLGRGATVAVARDSRSSGPALEAAVHAGLSAGGVQVEGLGILPTPALSALLRARVVRDETGQLEGSWKAGVMITASHNPPEDNGLKVFGELGTKPPRDFLDNLGATIDRWLPEVPSPLPPLPPVDRSTLSILRYFDIFQRACGASGPRCDDFQPLVGLHIVVDCANGAFSNVAADFLEMLGAKATALNTGPGTEINRRCGSLHPELLRDHLLKCNADYGIALDGDGDRGILLLSDGRVLDGDDLLWILGQSLPTGSVVVGTVMTNAGLEVALAGRGLKLERTPVGDSYVAEALLKHGNRSPAAPYLLTGLGGEPSGHLLLSPWIPCADGLLATVRAILALQAGADPRWPRQPQLLQNLRFPGVVPTSGEIQHRLADLMAELERRGTRIVVRPSGTEPLMRVMVEHPRQSEAEEALRRLCAALQPT